MPWRPDTEIIECQVGDRVIDLHNECTLLEIAVRCAPLLELDLRLLFDPEQRALSLTFSDVRQLVFTQDSDVAGADWSPRDVETFYALDFGFDSSGSAAIAVRTIIGDLRFSCSAVKLQLT